MPHCRAWSWKPGISYKGTSIDGIRHDSMPAWLIGGCFTGLWSVVVLTFNGPPVVTFSPRKIEAFNCWKLFIISHSSLCLISSWVSELLVTEEKACARRLGDGDENLEDVAGVCEPNVHVRIMFRFEKRTGKWEFLFDPCPKHSWNESTTSLADGWMMRHRHVDSARPPAALRKDLFSAGLVEKKTARFLDWRKLLLRSYKLTIKKLNTTVLEGDLQRPLLMRIRGSIEQFFFNFFYFFIQRSSDFRFAFLTLKVASPAFT